MCNSVLNVLQTVVKSGGKKVTGGAQKMDCLIVK